MTFQERHLLEETSNRQMSLALQAQGVSPERLKALQTTGGKLKSASAYGSILGAAGALGGALGGGLGGGPSGALAGGLIMGPIMGLGATGGQYLNLRDISKLSPQDIKKRALEAEKKHGSEWAEAMRNFGKKL